MLTSEAIAKIRAEAEQSKQSDENEVSLIEARLAGESAVRNGELKLQTFQEKQTGLLNPEAVKRAIAELGRALESEDAGRIREATQLLNSHLIQGSPLTDLFGTSAFSDLFATTPSRPARQTTPPKRVTAKKSVTSKRGNEVISAAIPDYNLGKIFGGGDFTLDPNLCFVLMPFEETFQPIYEDHIRPIVQNEGLSCLRADDIRGTSLITRDIWEKINRSRFIIADLSGQNPNVFYEVGLAHAIGKDVILLTQTMTDVPFDLKALRCVIYTYTPRGMKDLETALKATIAAVMKSG